MCANAYTQFTHWLKSNCMHSLTHRCVRLVFSSLECVSRRKHSTFHYIQIMFVNFSLIEVLLFSVFGVATERNVHIGNNKMVVWRNLVFFPPFELTQIFWRKNFVSFAFRGKFLDLIGFDRNESNRNTIKSNLSSHANDFNEVIFNK